MEYALVLLSYAGAFCICTHQGGSLRICTGTGKTETGTITNPRALPMMLPALQRDPELRKSALIRLDMCGHAWQLLRSAGQVVLTACLCNDRLLLQQRIYSLGSSYVSPSFAVQTRSM